MGFRSWLLAGCSAELERQRQHLHRLSTDLSTLAELVNRTQAARLSAELEDVRAAAEINYRGVRRELQRVYAKLSHEAKRELEQHAEPPTADETRARLREQLPIPKIGKGK